MGNLRRALMVSTLATGAAAAAWMMVSRWRDRAIPVGAEHSSMDQRTDRTRADEIEALTQQQKDFMLRELSDHL